MNTLTIWGMNILVFILSFFNAIFWGYTLKTVGSPTLSAGFLLTLVFNVWFILAMSFALGASLVTYGLIYTLGVARGRFFVSISFIATLLAAYFVLHESFGYREAFGMVLVIVGAILLG